MHTARVALLAVAALLPSTLVAQGSLSSQGFGYPPGQFSSRARATGGSFGEFDPQSPINPASLSAWGRPALFFQYDPEFRRISAGNLGGRASTSRFPVIAAALPIKQSLMFGVTTSTLLDRTWRTDFSRRGLIGPDSVSFNESTQSIGAMNDNRVAVGWSRGAVRLGGAVHAVTGSNALRIRREFLTTGFDTLDESTRRGFAGFAVSAGAEIKIARNFIAAGSYRLGGPLRAYAGDTLVAKASVPDRIGGALRYEGVGGVAIAASMNLTKWSRMGALGTSSLSVSDAMDYGLGVEARGPRWFESNLPVRAGYRRRTLPFTLAGQGKITESDVSAGFGLPLARTRSNLDFGLERATRWGVGGATEHAWTISFGFLVRQ